MVNKKLVIDIDNTISIKEKEKSYSEAIPVMEVVNKIKEYKESGFKICLYTARNMNTYKGNLGEINANTLPILIKWLRDNDIPYDEIIMGKPWCGENGFYVDDKAIRPKEFVNLEYGEILNILENDNYRLR